MITRHYPALTRLAACAVAIAAALATPAQAALVSYDEAIQGDLTNGNPLTTFVFDTPGVQSISGTQGAELTLPDTCPTATTPQFDCDSFAFTVAAGLVVTEIAVGHSGGNLVWRVGTGTSDYGGSFIGSLSNTDALTGLLLGTGGYNISWDTRPTFGVLSNYAFRITVAPTVPVPEPTSLALVAAALLAAGASRRRR